MTLNALVDEVARRLGNTRSVCRKCYIHPRVVESWMDGTLAAEMAAARKSFRKPVDGLEEDELIVLKWLKMQTTS
jgi:DNA topoisomerase-1